MMMFAFSLFQAVDVFSKESLKGLRGFIQYVNLIKFQKQNNSTVWTINCKSRVQKKIWNFPDLVLEKIIFSPLKMPKHLKKIWTLCWTNVSCHTLYGWHNARCADNNLCSAANLMRGAANTMLWCGRRNACEVLWVGQNQSWTPHMAKN